MKKIVSGLILVLFLSVSGFARKQKTSPDQEQEVKPTAQNNRKPAPTGAMTLESGTGIEARLEQTSDVNKASVGDRVVLTTTQTIRERFDHDFEREQKFAA